MSAARALEDQKIQVEGKMISAMDKFWCESKSYVFFWTPTLETFQDWLEMMEYFEEDLHWLLKLPHHRFWSQIVYDNEIHHWLASFLQNAPRPHLTDFWRPFPATGEEIYKRVYKLVFCACVRFCTHKESAEHFQSPTKFAQLIYDHYILDVPKMMDLCVLYGYSQKSLLTKMLENVFKHQPQYESDLQAGIASLDKIFGMVLQRLDLDHRSGATPIAAAAAAAASIDEKEITDLVRYVADIAITLASSMEIIQLAAQMVHEQGFHLKFAHYYEVLFPYLQKAAVESDEVSYLIKVGRFYLIQSFRHVLHVVCINSVLNGSSVDPTFQAEEFVTILSSVVPESHFLRDYHLLHPINDDLEIFQQAGVKLDSTRLDYVMDGLVELALLDVDHSENPDESKNKQHSENVGSLAGIELDSLVSQVRDLLPDLGEGFVEKCLRHYHFQTEKAINAILEGNLPSELDMLDRQLPRSAIKENKADNGEMGQEIVKPRQRSNKTVTYSELKTVMEDKKALEDFRPLYSQLANVDTEGSIYEALKENVNEYEDEYDDTYDDQAIGQAEPDAQELRRSFVVPRVLRPQGGDQEEESDEEEEQEEGAANRDAFVADPAKLREDAERRRQSQHRGRGGSSGGRGGTRDVVGRAKGQGQDKDVLLNRRHKTTHKGQNLRYLADKKRKAF